jgi:hypothetical protein
VVELHEGRFEVHGDSPETGKEFVILQRYGPSERCLDAATGSPTTMVGARICRWVPARLPARDRIIADNKSPYLRYKQAGCPVAGG